MKLNNKGFAITTALYGIMVLFLLLTVSSLGMMGTYKARLDKLTDESDCIVTKGEECVAPPSSECNKKTQYNKRVCNDKTGYYCTGADKILDGNMCFYNALPDITYGVCTASSDKHWITYKSMCYGAWCSPATNSSCGGICTYETCGCTWTNYSWSDTDCGGLDANHCNISDTREVCID